MIFMWISVTDYNLGIDNYINCPVDILNFVKTNLFIQGTFD